MSDTGKTEDEDETCDVVTGDSPSNMKTEMDTMSDTCLTENDIELSDDFVGKGVNKMFKKELEADMVFSEANTSYSLKRADKSNAFTLKSGCKHDMNSDHGNNSPDVDDILADNNVQKEVEMYRHDDSSDIEGNNYRHDTRIMYCIHCI